LAAAAAAVLYLSLGPAVIATPGALRPSELGGSQALFVLVAGFGALLAVGGLYAYVIRGSSTPELAAEGWGSLGTILACLGVAVVTANILTLPYFLLQGPQAVAAGNALTPGALVLSVISLDGSLLAVVYFRIVRPGVLSWEQMGLTLHNFGDNAITGIAVGIVCLIVSGAIELGLGLLGVKQTQAGEFAGIQGASLPQFIGVLIAGSGFVPLCEETFFRGYVFTGTRQRYGLIAGFVLSPLLFAAAHLNLPAFLPIFAAGAIFCFVYYRTGSLVPSMFAHAIFNGLQFIALYFSSQ
jgi:membrane protease YdiL (CAAX protease family)